MQVAKGVAPRQATPAAKLRRGRKLQRR
jgi:hypothetical protein